MISAEVRIKAQFYDLDPMQVVWHGNYPRFLEQARCALLDKLAFNYVEMEASGYSWPVVDMRIKYVRPIRFAQEISVTAELGEYENRLKILYRIKDAASGETLTKASTIQVAVDMKSQELCFEIAGHIAAESGAIPMKTIVAQLRHIAALLLLFTAVPAFGQATPQTLSPGQNLQGRFIQERHLNGLPRPLLSEGRFILSPEKGLIWTTERPFATTTIIGPGGIAQIVNGSETLRMPATAIPFLARFYGMLSAALSGDFRQMTQDFTVSGKPEGAAWTVTLQPLKDTAATAQIDSITINGGKLVDSVDVRRTTGDWDHMVFSGQTLSSSPLDAASLKLYETAPQ